jgi:hypothetical protein
LECLADQKRLTPIQKQLTQTPCSTTPITSFKQNKFYHYQMQKIPDYHLKPLHKLFRPYFSPYTNSYEIDYVYGGKVKVTDVESSKTTEEVRY